jgi:hypothetical protein
MAFLTMACFRGFSADPICDRCHWLQPRGPIKAPSFVISWGNRLITDHRPAAVFRAEGRRAGDRRAGCLGELICRFAAIPSASWSTEATPSSPG